MHYNSWSKLYFYIKFLELKMYISLTSTCIQNFSNWLFITFCSRCGMKWYTACRPTDDPFWVFLSPGAQEPVQTSNNTFFINILYFRHSSKNDNHPGPLSQLGFCTSFADVFFFFAISGASFKHFKQLFMTLPGFGLLTVWKLPRQVSYFVSSLL